MRVVENATKKTITSRQRVVDADILSKSHYLIIKMSCRA